jgi:hypothetical protein
MSKSLSFHNDFKVFFGCNCWIFSVRARFAVSRFIMVCGESSFCAGGSADSERRRFKEGLGEGGIDAMGVEGAGVHGAVGISGA